MKRENAMDAEIRMAQPVLVTGATGFIGRRVVARLLDGQVQVRVLVRPGTAVPEAWEARVDIVRGSISDGTAVEAAVRGAGTILHLAALVSDWGDERLFWEYTVEGSRHVFEQALRNGARVVLVSSIVVYGDRIRKGACPETGSWGRALGPYSRTKQAQEKLAWKYCEERGMRLSVVRPANVYGPGSGTWLHDVLPVLNRGLPSLISGGRTNAGLVYVDNVVDILFLAASREEALGRAYNACDGLDVSWKDYFSALALMAGSPEPRSLPRPLAFVAALGFEALWRLFAVRERPPLTREALNLVGSDNRIPMDRAEAELGYWPRISYAEGMENTRKYMETHAGG